MTARLRKATIPKTTAATEKMKIVTGRRMDRSTIFTSSDPCHMAQKMNAEAKRCRGAEKDIFGWTTRPTWSEIQVPE